MACGVPFGSRNLLHTYRKVRESAFLTTLVGKVLKSMSLNVKACVFANALINPTGGTCLSFCLDRNLVRYK